MGSFIYMLQNKDIMIDETKRLELEQRLETVFNESGMMGLSQMTLYDHKIVVMHPVRIENGYTTFYYNYFEDDVWENAGYSKDDGVYSDKLGGGEFSRAIEAAYILQSLYMNGPAYVIHDIELVVPYYYLEWFRYLFGTTYELPERDLMQMVELFHEMDRNSILIPYSDVEFSGSGYYIESVTDAIAVMYGTEEILKSLKIDFDNLYEKSSGNGLTYRDCIRYILQFLEKFKTDSDLSEEKQIDFLVHTLHRIAEGEAIEDFEKDVFGFLMFVHLTGNYAFTIKKISEMYDRDFWQLYKPFIDMKPTRFFSEDSWKEEQKTLIKVLSTADLFGQDPDDMLYFWKKDKELKLSEEVEKWFKELKQKFEMYVNDGKMMEKAMRYITDEIMFANENYGRIFIFADLLDETLDNLQDIRYQAIWRIFHDITHNQQLLEEGSVIFDDSALEQGIKQLKYNWGMMSSS